MTVYVAEIKGRGIAAFHANNGSDAERLLRDRVFRDDLMVLATGGLPLWDGVTDIEVRLAPPTRRQNGGHHAPKRSARERRLRKQRLIKGPKEFRDLRKQSREN